MPQPQRYCLYLQLRTDPLCPQDPANGGSETLGALLSRMLGLLSHPDPILPVFEAAAAAERERQRLVAEQRMLMQVGGVREGAKLHRSLLCTILFGALPAATKYEKGF